MKKITIIIALLAMFSCKSKSGNYFPMPPDTTKTVAIFYDVVDSSKKLDAVYRLTKETADLSKDPIVRGRETTYVVPAYLPKVGADKKQMKDSTGKTIMEVASVIVPKSRIIWDGKVDVDKLTK